MLYLRVDHLELGVVDHVKGFGYICTVLSFDLQPESSASYSGLGSESAFSKKLDPEPEKNTDPTRVRRGNNIRIQIFSRRM